MASEDEIAIVGIGCNFPGGEGIDCFWKVLEDGRNCTTEIPPERFSTREWYDPDYNKPDKMHTTCAALLDQFNAFDNQLFGISNEEAKCMDPQQKLLLECTYRALEDAGIPTEDISGTKTGVFVGLMNRDYELITNRTVSEINQYDGAGTAMSTAANRISFTFNLTGPSLTIDTACSSFLSALHFACAAIKQGDCESVLCGGVNCIIDPWKFISLSKATMISPEGISKPFSRKADGYGRGEGCGVLLLKPLIKAQEDFNKIWGVIRTSAVNQNGGSTAIRSSHEEQEKLLLSIYPACVEPSAVQYIEAHGTGNPLEDATEAESLGNVIGKKRPPALPPLKIGSVKGNIGHTESASGAAGLIKVLLMMHHGKIVPSLLFSESNSSINTEKLNLSIPTTVERWDESGDMGRVAGINCFGLGGTNAHVVVRQVKQTQVLPPGKRPVELFVLSAASGCSLKRTMEDTAGHISASGSITLPNLAYTSACRRSHRNYKYRKAFVASSIQDLEQQLTSAAGMGIVPSKRPPQLVFVFSSNGLNFNGICKTLIRCEPVFRDKCIEIKQLFQQLSPRIMKLTENEHEDLSRPEIAQPLLFTLQVALVTLLQYWGVTPTAAVGHSVGEVAAAHCAGYISLEDAVKIIYHRSRLQAKVTGGRMLVVGNVPVEEVSGALGAYSGKVCVAAFNSPQSCTLSGDADSINSLQKDLAERFSKQNVVFHVLNVPAANHSHMMDPVLSELAASLSDLEGGKSEINLISTATGKAASDGDFVTGNYWARQIRDPVSFAEAVIASAKDKENTVFVEIGPHKALQTYIIETLGKQTKVLLSLQTDTEYMTLLNLIKDIFEMGLNVNWQHFYEGYQSIPSPYPRYQFGRKNLMLCLNPKQQATRTLSNRAASSRHPLICSANDDNTEFICSVSPALTPYLNEYKNHGVALVPGSFFVELALAAVMSSSRPKVPLSLNQLNILFTAPCPLRERSRVLKIMVESQRVSEFRILSESANTVHVSGQVTKNPETSIEEKSIRLQDIFQRCRAVVSKEEVYEELSHLGFHYGPTFRQLNDVYYCEELKEAVTTVKVKGQTSEEMYEYYIHPVLLDCFLQVAGLLARTTSKSKVMFPSGISSLIVARPLEEEMMIYLKTSKSTENYLEFCGCFADKHGSVLAELKCVQIPFVKDIPREENDLLFENKWKEIISDQTMQNLPKAPRVVVFADKFGIAQQLKNYLHSESRFVTYQDWDKMLAAKKTDHRAQNKINLELQGYHDVLYLWGIQKLNETLPEKVVKYSVRCCEALRQVIVALKEKKANCSITIITYRTSERKVDHINTGFGLYGLTRTCMLEVPEITFQIIDISSTSPIDISALADVLVKYKAQDYPEVWIDEGRIYSAEIKQTQFEASALNIPSQPLQIQNSEMCFLYTADPYDTNNLSAKVANPRAQLGNHSVEVDIEKLSIHSEDYFPVSVSSCKFGKTLYWNSHTIDQHKLLALDFTGTVTATGAEVKKVKVGDHIVSCYPVSAGSRVVIPETVCFNTQKFPCFRNIPCMSFFWVAREVLHRTLPVPRHGEMLGVISTEPESVLCKVLTLSAQEVGWKTIITNHLTGLWQRVNQCHALIFLPPLNGIFKESLTCLFHLRDIVLVYGNEQPECLRYLIGSDHENIRIHPINLVHIFQKASLIQTHKDISWWLKSMNMKQLKHLTFSLFQQAGKSEKSDIAPSYFNCKSIPVAVLKSEDSETSDIPVTETDHKLFKKNAVYIVTAEFTGLGFETVKFVAENGGGRIVILLQGKLSPEVQTEINALQDHCEWSRIISLQCNIIFSSEVEKAIKSIGKIFPNCPIKGVFHTAMVLHDGCLETLTMSDFEEVLNPKVAGAINLHCAMQGRQLDHFVCYSSFSSFLGNATQSNYAAANSFLDLFCHYRRNSGGSGQSINWGPLHLGGLQDQEHIQNMLQTTGIEVLQVNDFHEYLKRSLLLNNPQQAVIKLNFQTLAHVLSRNLSLRSRFFSLVSEENSSDIPSQTSSLGEPVDYITSLLKSLSDANPGDLSVHTPLSSLGIDSTKAFTLQNRIFMERRVEIPVVKLLDPHSTVLTLILHLKENLKTTNSHVAQDPDAGSWL